MKDKAISTGGILPLVGVLTEPPKTSAGSDRPCLIVLNAGQLHHVGPNRLHVKIARYLAMELGVSVFRFDFRGVGDSPTRNGEKLKATRADEVEEVIKYLSKTGIAKKYALMGICGGGEVALEAASRLRCLCGVAVINCACMGNMMTGSIYKEARQRTQMRYYRKKVLDYKVWGRITRHPSKSVVALRTMFAWLKSNIRRRNYMGAGTSQLLYSPLATILADGVKTVIVFSEGSTYLDAFEAHIAPLLHKDNDIVKIVLVPHADHVFTPIWSQKRLMSILSNWMQALSVVDTNGD